MQPFKPQSKDAKYGSSAARDKGVGHETTDISVRGVMGFAIFLVVAGVIVFTICLFLFKGLDWLADRREEPRTIWGDQGEKRQADDRRTAAGRGDSEKQIQQHEMAERVQRFPQPRLQTDDAHDMQELRALEDLRLSHYYWVDKGAGKIHIPIAVALKIVAQRGLPTPPAVPGPSPAPALAMTGLGNVKASPQRASGAKH